MRRRHELNYQSPVLDALHRLITGVDAELLANALLDRHLAALTDSTGQYLPISMMHTSSPEYAGRWV